MSSHFGYGCQERITPPTREIQSFKLRKRTGVGGDHFLSAVARLLNARWARGACVVILAAWVLVTQVTSLAARPHSGCHAATLGCHTRWWLRNHDASPIGVITSGPPKLEGTCAHLSVPGKDGRFNWGNSLRADAVQAHRQHVAAFHQIPFTLALTPHVMVLMVVRADAFDHDDTRRFDRTITQTGHPRFAPTSSIACAQIVAWADTLRSSQTLRDFDVEMLVLDRRGDEVVEWHTQRNDCLGVKHVNVGTRSRRARGIQQSTRERPVNITAIHDFFLFLEQETMSELRATTLEKMVLAARGRHADLISVQPTVSVVDASNVVCMPQSPHQRHSRATCHVRGAPILLRVPTWLSPPQLKEWTGAVVELVTAARLHAREPVRSGLASLFCAGDDLVAMHSLRENELPFFDKHGHAKRNIAWTSDSCDRVRAFHPHLQTARARFSGAYQEVTSRDMRLPDTMRRDDRAAAVMNDHASTGGVVSNQQPGEVAPGFLLIVPWLEHGGADQFNVNLARALTRLHVRVVVVTTLSSAHPTARDFYAITPDVFHLPHLIASPRDTQELLNVFVHLIVSRNVDTVMISHSALGYKLVSHMRNALVSMHHGHVKFVDFVHLEEMEWGDGGYAAMSVAHAQQLDHTFAASHHVATWMRQRKMSLNIVSQGSEMDERISVAYIGIDTHALGPLTLGERARVRSQLLMPSFGEIDATIPVIAYIARMVDQKLPELFFEIVRQLREERRAEFVALAIGGGPKLSELRANISRHPSLERTVLTLGMLDHNVTISALAVADVLLLPSQNEGIALAVYEAMALGVTPVVSAVGGQCELVSGGAGACVSLVPGDFRSPAHLTAAAKPFVDELEQLIKSGALLRRQSRIARERVARQFGISSTMRALSRGMCGAAR